MNQSEHSYFIEEFENMRGIDLQALVASRLEDMADQVDQLYAQGRPEDAELLRQEGLMLAEAYDNEQIFFFTSDLSHS